MKSSGVYEHFEAPFYIFLRLFYEAVQSVVFCNVWTTYTAAPFRAMRHFWVGSKRGGEHLGDFDARDRRSEKSN